MRWIFGLIFITSGGLFLARNFSWLDGIYFEQLYIFWPLLLILLGISIFLKGKKNGEPVMAILVLASFLFIGYYLISHKTDNKENIQRVNTISEDIPSDIEEGKIVLNTGAISIRISDTAEKFVKGTSESNVFEPKINQYTNGKVRNFELKNELSNIIFRAKPKNSLDLKITKTIPIDLEINSGASILDLNLSEIKLKKLSLDCGASTIDLRLGSEILNDSRINIGAGASKVSITVPKNLGVNLDFNAALLNKNLNGFEKISNTNYKSLDYEKAEKKINLKIDAGVSSVEITRY